eukprot:jgi/Mesvir1/23074/Mv10000-RA.2
MREARGQRVFFKVDVFCKAAKAGAGKRTMLFGKKTTVPTAPKTTFGLEDMLSFQKDPIPCSLLKLTSDHSSRAVKLFQLILKYQGEEGPLAAGEGTAICMKVFKETIKRPELRDELYAQVIKQTQNNPSLESTIKGWELLHLCAAGMPPSKDFTGYVSEYIHETANDETQPPEIRALANRAWSSLKRCVKAGARRTVPSAEEIEALKAGRMLTTIAFFLDDTFEELTYDMTTTAHEAVESLANIIKLQNYQTFSLFECRKTLTNPKDPSSVVDEHLGLDDNRNIADVLTEFKNLKERSKGEVIQCKILFKKRLFRETDEGITEPMFINLSYVQAQHDYLLGNYPVGRDDAAQLAALQIISEIGSGQPETSDWAVHIEKYIPKQVLMTRAKRDWETDVLTRYKSMATYTKEYARVQLLRILRSLPYGNSVFFNVKRIEDPIGLLPGKLILGINKRGIHFFRPVPKEYLHSAELRDIMQFGSSHSAVFFKMRVAGVLHIFQFESKQGEDICVALQTHINDVMMRRYSKSKSQAAITQGEESRPMLPAAAAPPQRVGDLFEKHLSEVTKVLEEANRKIDVLTEEKRSLEAQLATLKGSLQDAEDKLRTMEASQTDLLAERESMAKQMTELKSTQAVATAKISSAEAASLKAEISALEEKLRKSEDALKKEKSEHELAENKLKRLEQQSKEEGSKKEEAYAAEVKELKEKISSRDKQLAGLADELTAVSSSLTEKTEQWESMVHDIAELQELREFKADVDRKDAQTAVVIRQQGERITELERLYKDEQKLRKQYFNAMEDMKGKIRVYARTRPLSATETANGQKDVIIFPDEYTLEHPWKDEKKNKEYQFDTVFGPGTTQEEVFSDTKYLVQSAVDGYNVCIFAYGQTGSGKTFTIYGSEENPGLTPRAIAELFRITKANAHKFSFQLKAYMLELYQDTLNDLLLPKAAAKKPLTIKKDSKGMVTVENATLVTIKDRMELEKLVELGIKKRHIAGTQMNNESSRSHLIFSVIIESTNVQTQALVKGKLSFVDLAGSERVKKSGSTGEQLKEAQAINKSLSALGDVISSLATEEAHIPYRNHKLTMLMSDSLGGNAKTLMFVNISPADYNLDETQNSLSYASRVRSIINTASKNVSSKEIVKLKKAIAFWKEKAGQPPEPEELEEIENAKNLPEKD